MKGGPQHTLPRTRKWYTVWSHRHGAAVECESQKGFTIIEVMIVLAVTGAMFASAAALISGRQAKAEFQQGIQQVQSQIQQMVSEVGSGYYPNLGNFKCVAPTGSNTGITLSSGSAGQGTNKDCTFLGKVLQFTNVPSNTTNQQTLTYAIAARRADSQGNDYTQLTQVTPTLVAPSTTQPTIPDNSEPGVLPYGLTVAKMFYTSAGADHNIGAFGILSSLGSISSTGVGLASGSTQLSLVPISGSSVIDPATKNAEVQTINDSIVNSGTNAAINNPDGGITICLASATTNQSGLIQIGGDGRTISVTLAIKDGKTC